jgi:hypothetical protein
MQRLRLLALAGILILSGGCDSSTSADREGTLVGRLEGAIWRGTAQAEFVPDTFLIWSSRRGDAGVEQRLELRVAETAPGAFTLVTPAMSTDASGYWELVGGDVVTYHADVTAGTIQFHEIDRRTGRASGTLSLTITGPRGTWRFEDGEFEARDWRDPHER